MGGCASRRSGCSSNRHHANQFFLAQSDRTLVCRNHTETNPPREQATADGDFAAATLFEKMRADEIAQAETFKAALQLQIGACAGDLVAV